MKLNLIQKKNLLVISIIGIVYFCIFIIPNLTGSKDAIMLSVFEQDEFAEYPFVLRMLTSNLSFYQAIRYFIIYLFYYYGYPFYFFSALWLLPVKWIIGSEWTQHTQLIVLILRQMLNVLPGILSVGFLVYLQTRFVSRWKTVVLFSGLLLYPPLVINNLWWHPDGLLLLFCVLALFFLDRDQLRFKKDFFFAAMAIGLAIATKLIGALFFLAILVYLVLGIVKKSISIRKSLLYGALFILVMSASYLISNPVFLLPIERAEVIAAYKSGFSQLTSGFYEKSSGIIKWAGSWSSLKSSYGGLFFIFLTIAVPVFGIYKNKNRFVNIMVLSWAMVNYVYFLFFVSVMKEYYLLPSSLPLVSCLGSLLAFYPDDLKNKQNNFFTTNRQALAVWTVVSLVIIQSIFFINTDFKKVVFSIQKEEKSKSILFFDHLNKTYLSRIPESREILIYRDWRVYVRKQPNWTIEMDWDLADYEYLQTLKPDVLLLEMENIHYFSQASLLENSVDFSDNSLRYGFYLDALNETIPGYQLIYKDDFGYFFVTIDLYEEFFQ